MAPLLSNRGIVALLLLAAVACPACSQGVGRRHYIPRRRAEEPIPPAADQATIPPAATGAAPAPTPPPPPTSSPTPARGVSEDAQPLPTLPTVRQASATVPQVSDPTPPNPATALRELHRRAAERYATIDSYIARLHRREEVNGRKQPEELLLFKFRKQPWSVYFKWIGAEGKGREVTYVKGRYGDQIHTLLAAGDNPFMGAGRQMAVSPDNVFIRSRTRHSIQEAGIGAIIDKYGALVDAADRGDPRMGVIRYLGRQKRPEYDAPMDAVERLIPPGLEPQLPRGGRRWLFFDSASGLPVLTITHDDRGNEVEYYCYDHLQYPVRLDDADFDPERLWPSRR